MKKGQILTTCPMMMGINCVSVNKAKSVIASSEATKTTERRELGESQTRLSLRGTKQSRYSLSEERVWVRDSGNEAERGLTHGSTPTSTLDGVHTVTRRGTIPPFVKGGTGGFNTKTTSLYILTALLFLFLFTTLSAFDGWQQGEHDGTPGLQFSRLGTSQNVSVRRGAANATNIVIPASVTVQGEDYTVSNIAHSGFRWFTL